MHRPRVYRRLARLIGSSRCVRGSLRFAAREMARSERVAEYKLRHNGLTAVVRHPLVDSWVVEEVFRNNSYEPPEEIRRWLAQRPAMRVVDLGGHIGLFGLYVLGQYPQARITSFEPDPKNLTMIKACIRANGLDGQWTVVPAAAQTSDGTLEFVSGYHLSHVSTQPDAIDRATLHQIFPFLAKRGPLTGDRTVVQVEARDCFPLLGEADFVKIDIEGGEWALLDDSRLAETPAQAIVLECHHAGALSDDPDREATTRLDQAGFEISTVDRVSAEATVIWALKRN